MLKKTTIIASVALLLVVAGWSSSFAQAWLPEKGQLSLWTMYSQTDVGDHLFGIDGELLGNAEGDNALDFGDISARTLIVGAEYGLARWMAVDASVSYIESRYRGLEPEGEIDDGGYDGDIQDANLLLRFGAVKRKVVFTPFIGAVIPVTDYDIVGHAAIGTRLRQYPVGFNVAMDLSPLLRKAYVQGQYQYSFVENVQRHSLDRSNTTLEFGYVLTPNWLVRAFGAWQETYDGIEWHEDIHDADDFHTHDQAARSSYSRAGFGASYRATQKMSIFGSLTFTTHGENTHDATAFAIGTNWDVGK